MHNVRLSVKAMTLVKAAVVMNFLNVNTIFTNTQLKYNGTIVRVFSRVQAKVGLPAMDALNLFRFVSNSPLLSQLREIHHLEDKLTLGLPLDLIKFLCSAKNAPERGVNFL